jgi:hypothetical protein
LSKELGDLRQQCLTLSKNAAIIPALLEVEAKERKRARQVVFLQMLVTLLGASIAYSIKGTPQFSIAVLSGGGISIVNSVLLAWRMVRAATHPAHEAHHQLRLMYFYATERFLVVVALLCLGIVVLKLSPLALLGGFVMGQAVFLAGRFILSSFR